ncbi:peptide chain release factor N(5)-glutamine methyltransferase [Halalkalibacter sp. APA_J-10(15)]|uniref:peptide chain release factor N(5)-glutamine methyltransferase n=1 Tax=Halalkalibacter sp. APA_J-10(15) TaxID=2933805 RepID=UPI001FF68695|nr:peptide chain release factor N(5)-glutamine methyltransferase [Halalkalibacter sp. APA_J-10(15)]MCK0470029.1 peptide chain release factor N(5)-glutamine methyltransferase [Halalkalibacter sp. APA_J-10(15)]
MPNNRTIQEALQWASSFLAERKLEQPVGELLLRHYLQVNRTHFLMMLQEPLSKAVWNQLSSDLEQHAQGVPVQHLIGYEIFYGRRFKVNGDVLIPRPETEELVEVVSERAQKLFQERTIQVVDVGTGSGAIAITLALENAQMNIEAIDISPQAIMVAKENARSLEADVTFMNGDLLSPYVLSKRKVDVVVSNPPYIPVRDEGKLAVHVKGHEPHLALFGGEDGLDVYRTFMTELPQVIEETGLVAFEVGIGQAQTVCEMLSTVFPHAVTEIKRDINGKERIVIAYGTMTTRPLRRT